MPQSSLPLFCRFVALLAVAFTLACGPVKRPDGGEGPLPVGAVAPDLEAQDQTGAARRLSAERGHRVLVYFYPKDGTPGCTAEACAIRDSWNRFEQAGVKVFGVSAQTQATHADFAREHKLPFPLLADPDLVWAKAFGVGTIAGLTRRVSFLLDREGKVAKIYPDVVPASHAAEVLADAALH